MKNNNLRHAILLATTASLSAATPALAQEQRQLRAIEEVVVTGTRVANRTNLDTASAVDVINRDALTQSGTTELNQALAQVVPSYSFPRPGLADGTDTIRPATLRGLAPDQTLVLVNSKRRHQASLVNVNGTVGRGSSAVDLNTIPMAIVERIEVLRDGAAAQYGSDAIAGVINLRLREARDGGGLDVRYGARNTKVKTNQAVTVVPGATWPQEEQTSRREKDGDTLVLSGWKGFALGEAGFLTVAAEYKDADRTERGGFDVRQQYPLLPDGSFDPREQTFDRFSHWYGDPDVEQWTLFANSGYDLGNGASLYGWASYQNREATSAGFYRRALDARNVIEIHPDGFLPLINPEVEDYSIAGGVTWNMAEWDMDASLVYGYNSMDFTIRNTVNRSLGTASGTVFDAGGFDADQLTFNVSAVRGFDVGIHSLLNVALGVEARRESYSISAGEPDSFINGGVLLNGNPTASGSQVFPGFRPENEVSENRRAVGAFVDIEGEVTEQLLLSAAVRVEDYSDFGSAIAGKLSARYDFNDAFAVRGTVQNGFRAPSLQQQFFTATSTNFIDGVPFDITTFPATSDVAAALGAQELDAEESLNFSLGFVLNVGDLSLTVDAYRIEIDDQIVLSENLTQANVRQFLEDQGFIAIGGGRFFINGVETVTKGVDIVANYPIATDGFGFFDLTLAANFNSIDVKKVPITDELAALDPAPALFDRVNTLRFEKGTPKDKITATVNWNMERFGATLRGVRYGKVLSAGTTPANDFNLAAKWVVDLEGRMQVTDNLRVSLGVDNLFDTYPTRTPAAQNGTSATPFSNLAPFGRNGRQVYGRLSLAF
ncbi:MAG: TonB-dependent receptor [Gammaproteobacteria bacterium]|nr:TonB-dependent receptor [Gammaproteobacteria bacterium]